MPQDDKDFFFGDDGTVKFPKQESQKFEPIPNGTYDFVIASVEPRSGKESGDTYFAFELRVDQPGSEFDDRAVWENISPKVHWRMTQVFEAVYGTAKVDEGDEISMNIFDLVSAHVRAVVGSETGRDGVLRNRIVRFINTEEDEEREEARTPAKAAGKRAAAASKPQKVAAKPKRRR